MLLYRFLSTLALVAYAPIALAKSLTGRRRLGDLRGRLGRSPYPDLAGGIWVHAVSVGEVGVARSLLDCLARLAPGVALGLSVTTAAGRELAQKSLPADIRIFAFPFDLPGPVATALSCVRPGLVLLTETEIWPLFLEQAQRRSIPVALVNGRISRRSFARYRLVRPFFERVLHRISLLAMQSEEDAQRVRALGAPSRGIHVTGNVKFDIPAAPPFQDAARLREAASGRPILVVGSSGEGEEEALLKVWRPLTPRCLLVFAPRRPERFDGVASLIERSGWRVLRRSRSFDPGARTSEDVYLLDSIGELASVYGEASWAFIGGSLKPGGGHNPIEAWAQGVPVVTGPHMENFKEIARQGEQEGFLERVPGAGELARLIASWLDDPGPPRVRGELAREFVSRSRGAAESTARLALSLLEGGSSGRRAVP